MESRVKMAGAYSFPAILIPRIAMGILSLDKSPANSLLS